MDKPVLIVEAPELSDNVVASFYSFLQDFMLAFESHYYPQLARHHRRISDSSEPGG